MSQEYSVYCMNCRQEVDRETTECECGGKYFVYGEKVNFKDGKVTCDCGSSTNFQLNVHMNYENKSVKNYICTQCNNVVGTVSYRDNEMLKWY